MSGNSKGLCPLKLGFAMGLWYGLGLLLLGWAGWLFAYGHLFIRVVASVYLGYAPTFVGAIIGAVWGFVDLFIFGVLLAWIYNCGKK